MSLPPGLGLLASKIVGMAVGDVVVTREEIAGLMEGRLYTPVSPTGTTRLTDWMRDHAGELGRAYSSELARRSDRTSSYEALRGGR